jgi:iduronate 2-sulfatase
MKIIGFLHLWFPFILLACTTKSNPEQGNWGSTKPNILFIAVDDLRPELGIYGASHIQSPAIDKLAEQSLIFNRAYCNVPVCGASRASLMSGVRPGRYRFLNHATYLDIDYPQITSLPKHFRNNGYTTISNGKVYHHKNDDISAWDVIWGPEIELPTTWRNYVTAENIRLDTGSSSRGYFYERADVHDTAYFDGQTTQKSINDLKNLAKNGNPFFLAVGLLKPHLPFNAPSKYWDMYDPANISLPDNYLQPETTPRIAYHNFGELRQYADIPKGGPVSLETANKLIHGYYACVSYIDAQIGMLMDALVELDLDKNTIVILWGDHGWNLGDHQMWCKHCNFKSSLHVPLMVKVPGQTTGKRTDAITEFIDIFPSLCELAGLPIPEHIDGESFVPLMKGAERKKDFAISKFNNGVTLIRGTFFYTEWLDQDHNMQARMLFDHSTDPLELNNLSEKQEYQETVKELSKMLHDNWGEDFFMDRRVTEISYSR